MLNKQFRLKTKDIKFLTKRGKTIFSKYFGLIFFPQYPNLHFNQISVNIGLKYDKRAVIRNKLKRQINTVIQTNKLEEQKINGKYYKIFIFLNKKNIELAKKEVANNKDLHRFLSEQLSFLISKIK